MNNLKGERRGTGLAITTYLLILLVLTTCICSGQKSTWGYQTFVNQTDYSIYSGKRARQIHVVTVFATLRIDVPDFHSWHQEKRLTKLRYRVIPGLVYYRNQVLMQRRCSRTKLYPSRSTIRFSLNRFRTVWIDQSRN